MLRGAVGGHDLAQDLFEHRVALLADELGPAAADGVAARLRRLAGLPAMFRGDDALGAAIFAVWLERDVALGLELADEIVGGLLAEPQAGAEL